MPSRIAVLHWLILGCMTGTAWAASPGLGGHWDGVMIREGSRLKTTFDFRDGAGGWQGSFSAPALRALRVPLARVSFAPPRVHFELVGDFETTVFEGELSGNHLSGSFREGQAQGTFQLDRGPAPAAKHREKDIRFSNGDVELAGTLLLPLAPGPHPAVLFLHGSGAEGRFGGRFLAEYLAKHGIAALIYDKRGVGQSTGDWRTAGFHELAGDARAGLKWLRTRPEIRQRQIGIYGHSQGGSLAPMVAAQSPEVAFLVSAAGAGVPMWESEIYSLTEQTRAQGVTGKDLEEAQEFIRLTIHVARTGGDWDKLEAAQARTKQASWARHLELPPRSDGWWAHFRKIADYDSTEFWERVTVPALLVYGERDGNVPVAASVKRIDQALTKAGNPDYTMLVLPRAAHELKIRPEGSRFEWSRDAPGFADLVVAWIHYRVDRPRPGEQKK